MIDSQIHKSNRPKSKKNRKGFAKKLDLKGIKFPVKIRDILKIKKEIPMALELLLMEIKRQKHPIYVSKNILSCMIILYIVEENIFIVIVYKPLVNKKY